MRLFLMKSAFVFFNRPVIYAFDFHTSSNPNFVVPSIAFRCFIQKMTKNNNFTSSTAEAGKSFF